MPELPEVERCRGLVATCIGKKVTHCEVAETGGGPRHGRIDTVVLEDEETNPISKVIVGRTLEGVGRKGKHIYWTLSGSGLQPIFHFGMTGGFVVEGLARPTYQHSSGLGEGGGEGGEGSGDTTSSSSSSLPFPPRFTKLLVTFEGGSRVAFHDARRLGRVRLRAAPLTEPPLSLLAVDPVLDSRFQDHSFLPTFIEKLRGVGAPIKAVLLDQERILCGLGNWMVDEVGCGRGGGEHVVCVITAT
jgi:formamidopyrimidine-DNA glycosylase